MTCLLAQFQSNRVSAWNLTIAVTLEPAWVGFITKRWPVCYLTYWNVHNRLCTFGLPITVQRSNLFIEWLLLLCHTIIGFTQLLIIALTYKHTHTQPKTHAHTHRKSAIQWGCCSYRGLWQEYDQTELDSSGRGNNGAICLCVLLLSQRI